MSSLRELLKQLTTTWTQLSVGSRSGVIAAAVVAVALVVLTGVWSARPKYVPLARDLAPSETAELVSKLEAEGIHAKMNFAASTVLDPKSKWTRARRHAGDRVSHQLEAPEWNDSVLGDPDMNHFRMTRHREQSLARTIRRMDGISDAVVHLAQPEPTPFIQEQQPATASVVIEVRSGTPFARETAAAIVALVADSVEGVSPDGVSVMDTRGRMLASGAGGLNSDIGGQFEYQRQLEVDLATKANSMLIKMLGERRAIVRVSANIDFTRTERIALTYDPDVKVRESEDITTKTTTQPVNSALGPAGASSNLGPAAIGQNASLSKTTEETNNTKYLNGETKETITELPGRIKRLTVAVMVHTQDPEGTGGAIEVPPTEVDLQRVEAVVKQAVGFDTSRGDEIEVMLTQFAGLQSEEHQLTQVQQWEMYSKLARSSSLGLAAIVALLLGLLTIYRLRPVTIRVEGEQDSSQRRERTLAQLSGRVKQNPEMMKAVISAWLDGADARATEDDHQRHRKAA